MKNLKIYSNNCKDDILSKMALKKNHAEYTLGKDLSATIDIGTFRDHQEDSVIILEHPKNKNYKLIGVSDGVGGLYEGDLASNHVAKKLILWFEKLDISFFENTNKLKEEMETMLKNIMEDSETIIGAATLAAAIVGKEETLIVNIGDSRIYTYKNGTLTQETEDDSKVQEMYNEESIPSKELMRFHKNSNYITQAIEAYSNRYTPKYKIIKNSKYDRIFAFTDGVTDCLSTKDLENIIRNKKKDATKEIVNRALNNHSFLWNEIANLPSEEREILYGLSEIMNSDYYHDIPGGKDNASAAEYRKK